MEFTPNLMHALCYWKRWLSSKNEYSSSTLTTYCKSDNYCGASRCREIVHIPPDRGEFANIDYTLKCGNENLCILETEYGAKLEHTQEDFPKLCMHKSPLKVMVNSDIGYISKLKYMQDTIQSYLANGELDNTSNEEWLFLGFPYMGNGEKWPTKPSEVRMRMHTFSLPCNGNVVLREPDWNIWEKNQPMEDWLWSQHCQ